MSTIMNYFRPVHKEDPSFFDEGPNVSFAKSKTSLTLSSSISTIEIDAFRQGIELTQIKHFDAGLAKIHAGEPGHILRKNRFGMEKNFRNDPGFQDLDFFSPVRFIETQQRAPSLNNPLITFPIISSDNEQSENAVFDGVIEPLTIRARAGFFSIDVPFEAHEIKGAVMTGNTDTTWASDSVLTVSTIDNTNRSIAFLDLVDMLNGHIPLNGFFNHVKSSQTPFVDARYPRNVPLATNYDLALFEAVSLMSGSTDNYVSQGKRSSTSGWVYDYTAAGTDSLAFGEMTH